MDCLFVVTNAPGRSAFNRVERRMAPLSAQLSGVILNNEKCGIHLDSQGKTIDPELEKRNFACAGQALADIWNDMVIDEFPVIVEYKEPTENPKLLLNVNDEWYLHHVRESQYLLQVLTFKGKGFFCLLFTSTHFIFL